MTVPDDSTLHASANNNESKLAPILEREQALNRKNSSKDLEIQGQHDQISDDKGGAEYKVEIVWINVIRMVLLHVAFVTGLYYMLSGRVMLPTVLFGALLLFVTAVGVTGGAHRLFSHRSYKAKRPLQLGLLFAFQMAFQNSLYVWCRDHRLHHKHSDTDADPHNINRGFFFAHVGWLLARKHPMVKEKGKTIDMSDLEADPVIMFQHRYHIPLGILVCFTMPAVIPWALWGESIIAAFLVCSIVRLVVMLHLTWLINSAAHMWGTKPYDKGIHPTDNVWMGTLGGEGWHNYHHTFPWDYRTGELGGGRLNIIGDVIDFFHAMGWAYDLKIVPKTMIEQRAERTGDGTWTLDPAGEYKSSKLH